MENVTTAPGPLKTPEIDWAPKLKSLIGHKATIVKFSEMGFPHSIKCEIKDVYEKDYAQYKNCLTVVYRPKGERTDYVWRIKGYSSFVVYVNHVEADTEMFVKTLPSSGEGGLVMSESFTCFSDEYMFKAIASVKQDPFIVNVDPVEVDSEPAEEDFK